jgi:hypothetical protein
VSYLQRGLLVWNGVALVGLRDLELRSLGTNGNHEIQQANFFLSSLDTWSSFCIAALIFALVLLLILVIVL